MIEYELSDTTCANIALSLQKLCECNPNRNDGQIGVMIIVGFLSEEFANLHEHPAGFDLINAGKPHQTGGIEEAEVREFVEDVRSGIENKAVRIELTSEAGTLFAVTLLHTKAKFTAMGTMRIPTRM